MPFVLVQKSWDIMENQTFIVDIVKVTHELASEETYQND